MMNLASLKLRQLSPAEVLATLNDMVCDDVTEDVVSADMSVADYAAILWADHTTFRWCEQRRIRTLGFALEAAFQLRNVDWNSLLYPMRERRLGELCGQLARIVQAPAIDPVVILGRPCLTAGAFLTFKSMLERSGLPVNGLAPSTPAASLLQPGREAVWTAIRQLAPGLVAQLHLPAHWSVWLFIVGGTSFVLGWFGLWWLAAKAAALISLRGVRDGRRGIRHRKLGEIVTVRDLTRVILVHHLLNSDRTALLGNGT